MIVMRRKQNRGFTLVETMIFIFIASIILGGLAWIAVGAGHVSVEQAATANMNEGSRVALDTMRGDVMDATEIVLSYSYSGTTYTTGPSTLILSLPWYTYSSGIPSAPNVDMVVYYLKGTTLYRLLVPAANSPRGKFVANTPVLYNVSTLTINYLHCVSTTGTGSAVFDLDVAPLGTPTYLNATVTSNGVNMLSSAGSLATFSGSTLTFASAPASGVPIDVIYPVDSTLAANQLFITQVSADVVLVLSNPSLPGQASSQSVEVGMQARLRNNINSQQ
jgi:type II secretory pathway pseudopilin PulG